MIWLCGHTLGVRGHTSVTSITLTSPCHTYTQPPPTHTATNTHIHSHHHHTHTRTPSHHLYQFLKKNLIVLQEVTDKLRVHSSYLSPQCRRGLVARLKVSPSANVPSSHASLKKTNKQKGASHELSGVRKQHLSEVTEVTLSPP